MMFLLSENTFLLAEVRKKVGGIRLLGPPPVPLLGPPLLRLLGPPLVQANQRKTFWKLQ